MSHLDLSPIQVSEVDSLAVELVSMTPWRELGYRSETLERYLQGTQEGFQCLCLHVDGSRAGVIALRSPWLRGTLLELLAVLPDFQHQGLGKWLMQWLLTEAKSRNQRNLWTLVSAFNVPALHFYQSQGFVSIGQLNDFIVTGQHEMLLRRVIHSPPESATKEAI